MNAVLSGLALALTLALFVPYGRALVQGRTRPHPVSWLIWASGTALVFAAQIAGGGGIGAWPIGVSALLSFGIAALAMRRRAPRQITRTDALCLAAALTALPAWWLTQDPLVAVVLLTSSDLLGFVPTLRSSWWHPHEERAAFYALGALRNALVVAALEHHNLTTVLFPAAVGVACVLLATVLPWRRRVLDRPGA